MMSQYWGQAEVLVGVIACDYVTVLGVRSDRSAGRCNCLCWCVGVCVRQACFMIWRIISTFSMTALPS